MAERIREAVRLAGVVGAGGAGFPTHVKLQASVDTVIANGAECEPLLACDKAAMQHHAELVLRGLSLVREATGADRAVVALKSRKAAILEPLRRAAEAVGAEVRLLDDVYPAGDEQVLVHEVTGRIVPESGLPLQVGCVVGNVITLMWVARAVDQGAAVTERRRHLRGGADDAHRRIRRAEHGSMIECVPGEGRLAGQQQGRRGGAGEEVFLGLHRAVPSITL